jgi:thiol-disulfide isomerase/thioredoxin
VQTTKTFGCSIKWAYKKESAVEAVARWNAEEVTLNMADLEELAEVSENNSEKLRLINVWATWCGPCVSEFPQLIEIFRMYRNRDFEMVTISADDPDRKNEVLAFLRNNHASTTNYLCSSGDRYKFIDAIDEEWPGALPYTILVKPGGGGEIIYRKLGIIDALELKKTIVEYLGRYYFKP